MPTASWPWSRPWRFWRSWPGASNSTWPWKPARRSCGPACRSRHFFHLAALGPALVEDGLLEAARRQLESGATGDMGLMDPGGGPGPGAPGMEVDLGWFRPLNLAPRPDEAAARRALSLALDYDGDRLAFSGAGVGLAQVQDYPRLFSWLADRAARRAGLGRGVGLPGIFPVPVGLGHPHLAGPAAGAPGPGPVGPGARADVAIYDLASGRRFPTPGRPCRTLLKAGELVVDDYRLVNAGGGQGHLLPADRGGRARLCSGNFASTGACARKTSGCQPELPVEWRQVQGIPAAAEGVLPLLFMSAASRIHEDCSKDRCVAHLGTPEILWAFSDISPGLGKK